jgi:hypothetical protein
MRQEVRPRLYDSQDWKNFCHDIRERQGAKVQSGVHSQDLPGCVNVITLLGQTRIFRELRIREDRLA